MLRVEFNHDRDGAVVVRLFGRVVGPYAEDARIAVARLQLPPTIVVDLSEVSFIDSLGEQVLLWLGRLGATFVVNDVYTRWVCERLQLRIAEKRSGVMSGAETKAVQ